MAEERQWIIAAQSAAAIEVKLVATDEDCCEDGVGDDGINKKCTNALLPCLLEELVPNAQEE